MFKKAINGIGHFLSEEMWENPEFHPTAALLIGTIVLLPLMISMALSSPTLSSSTYGEDGRFILLPKEHDGEIYYATEYHHLDGAKEYSFNYANKEKKSSSASNTSEGIKIVNLGVFEKDPYVEMKFREDGLPDLNSIILHIDESDINVVYPSPITAEIAFGANDDPGPGPGPVAIPV